MKVQQKATSTVQTAQLLAKRREEYEAGLMDEKLGTQGGQLCQLLHSLLAGANT